MPKDEPSEKVTVAGADSTMTALALAVGLAARRRRKMSAERTVISVDKAAPGGDRGVIADVSVNERGTVERVVIDDPSSPGSREAKRNERYPNYQCAVRPHITYDVAGKPRVTFKPNGRAATTIKHGAANTHPGKRGKRGKRGNYRHVRR